MKGGWFCVKDNQEQKKNEQSTKTRKLMEYTSKVGRSVAVIGTVKYTNEQKYAEHIS